MLTIQDLINKGHKEVEKTITIEIAEMKGDIKIRIPNLKELEEMREKHGEDYNNMASDIIYNCCIEPKLTNDEILSHYNCMATPYQVVDKIFGETTKAGIATIVMEEIDVKSKVKKKAERIKK
ncbi:MAG: phage tail assembly chaperone [Lactococcus garvieae]